MREHSPALVRCLATVLTSGHAHVLLTHMSHEVPLEHEHCD